MKQPAWYEKLNSWVNGDLPALPEPPAHNDDCADRDGQTGRSVSFESSEYQPAEGKRLRDRQEHEEKGTEEAERTQKGKRGVRTGLIRLAAIWCCIALLIVLLLTVAALPQFGREDNAPVNETSARYIEKGVEDVGATNLVANIILVYRGFDTYGESCVLFLGATSVIMLLACDRKNTSRADVRILAQSERIDTRGRSQIVSHIAAVVMPVIVLYGLYILCNGHLSPGGGFAGGSILGGALILCENAFGTERVHRFFNHHVYHVIKVGALILYAVLIGWTIFAGANGLPDIFPKGHPGSILSAGIILPVNVAVGLEVACTMYAFYTYFAKGDL